MRKNCSSDREKLLKAENLQNDCKTDDGIKMNVRIELSVLYSISDFSASWA